MIGRIARTLIEKDPSHLLVNCHDVGYEVNVPISTFYNLPTTGEKVALLMQQVVREDAYLPYGFDTATERKTFRQLIRISGIGTRITLAVLSGMSVAELAQVVTLQEAGRLTYIPGVGKKMAERLLLELKGKLSTDLSTVPGGPAILDDAVNVLSALLALEYPDKEAALVTEQAPVGTGISEETKLALKTLPKG